MLALWRASIRRSRADWPFALGSWLLLLCAATLLAAVPVYGDGVATRGLAAAVLRAAPADRIVGVQLSVAAGGAARVDAAVSDALRAALSPDSADISAVVRTDTLRLATGGAPTTTSTPDQTSVLLVAAHRGIDRHARIVAGRWATPGQAPVEATLSEGAAGALGVSVGDVATLVGRSSGSAGFEVRIVGTWRADAIDDGYWAGSKVEVDGSETSGSYTYRGPLEILASDLLAHVDSGYLRFEWRAIPNAGALTPDNVGAVRANLLTLAGRLSAALPSSSPVIRTSLPDVLAAAADATLVERSSVLLLMLQFTIVAGYATVLLAVLVDERRRLDGALLRSRGATRGHLAALAGAEGIVVAVPAVALAPFLASGLIWLLSSWGVLAGLGSSVATDGLPAIPVLAFALAAVAGVAYVISCTLPVALAGFSLATVRRTLGRPLTRSIAQRAGLDLALLALAAIALWELRTAGGAIMSGADGGRAIDPLLVAVPAIGLLAGAVLSARLVPRAGEVAERLLPRSRGLVPPLLGRGVARQAHRFSRIALLLVLASALGTFAATYGASWSQSQAEQATFRAPLDIRATSSQYSSLADWGAGSAYRGLPGVNGGLRVDRDQLDVGRAVRNAELVGLDAGAAKAALDPATNPSARLPGPAPALLDTLRAARPATAAIALPSGVKRLRVGLDSDLTVELTNAIGPGVPLPRQAVDVSVIVVDADGLHRIPVGSAEMTGSGQRFSVPLAGTVAGVPYRAAAGAKLEAVELSLSVFASARVTGTLHLLGVEWSPSDEEADWTALPIAASAGWSWGEILGESVAGYAAPARSPGTVALQQDDEPVQSRLLQEQPVVFRLWAPPAVAAVPAIVSDAFVAASAASAGDTVSATVGGFPLSVSIAGRISRLAPVDPATPLVLVDAPTLALVRYATWGIVRSPAEWWLSVSGDPAAVSRLLTADPFDSPSVVDRAALEQSMRDDPIASGVVGVLTLGGLATMFMALVGFFVGAAATLRDRRSEIAVLEALGTSRRAAAWWLTAELAVPVVLSLAGGWLLGNALAWLVLPAAAFSTGGSPAVPAPALVIPAAGAAAFAAFGALLVLVAGAAARRTAGASAVGPLLRDERR